MHNTVVIIGCRRAARHTVQRNRYQKGTDLGHRALPSKRAADVYANMDAAISSIGFAWYARPWRPSLRVGVGLELRLPDCLEHGGPGVVVGATQTHRFRFG